MNPPSVEDIRNHLVLAIGQDGAPLLTKEQVEERARTIYEETRITGFLLLRNDLECHPPSPHHARISRFYFGGESI